MARAVAGALLFSLPILMTMEMWWLGLYMSPARIVILLLAFYPALVGLSHFVGFDDTGGIGHAAVHALVAYGVGIVCSTAMLGAFAVLGAGMSAHEIAGKIALQASPAALGALLAQTHFGSPPEKERRRREASYAGHLFFIVIGALYVALTVASTEEMIQIADKMSDAHALVAAGLSLALLHAFLYGVGFAGHPVAEAASGLSTFFRLTVVGYALALAISAFLLWTFGRFDHISAGPIAHATIVLGLPAALGGAAARLTLDTE
jgi:putative integral membrane protein (TIGR02587 family)